MESVEKKCQPALTGINDLDKIILDAERNRNSYRLPDPAQYTELMPEGPVKFMVLNDSFDTGTHTLINDPGLLGEEDIMLRPEGLQVFKAVGRIVFDQLERHTLWPFRPLVRDAGNLLGLD